MDFDYALNQLSRLSNTSTDVKNKIEFLDLIFSDEYTGSRIMSLRDGEYRQDDFTLNINTDSSSNKFIRLLNPEKRFSFYWILTSIYKKPLKTPHEIEWILNNFRFGEKYEF